jgi:hypothetical protein
MSSRHSLSNPVTMPMISSVIFFIQAKVSNSPVDRAHARISSQILESSSPYDRVRDSGYETTSSSTERQRFLAPSSPSNVSLSPDGQFITVTYFTSSIPSHPDTSLSSSFSSSNTIPRTLTTFSQLPSNNATGNDSSSMMINPRLAEQEIIEV